MMWTNKQESLIKAYLLTLGDAERPLYLEIANYLSDIGYHPHKNKTQIIFKHGQHSKQIAKMGIRNNKEAAPFFTLRFSACRGYSKRFEDIVSAAIIKYPHKTSGCTNGRCGFCAGEPHTHVYAYSMPDGETKTHCGAYALEIPGLTADDVEEIKRLIGEEHAYLMTHEAHI